MKRYSSRPAKTSSSEGKNRQRAWFLARNGLNTTGRPLGRDVRAIVEPRFGVDLSGVRVHTDGSAAAASSALGARAFTAGHDIAFAAGEYVPQNERGLRLLSHELAHVAQQQAGIHLKNEVGEAGDQYEAHADAVADRVVKGEPAQALLDGRGTASVPQLQMQRVSDNPKQSAREDPKAALLRSSFQKMLIEQQAMAAINAPIARELAKAYVSRPEKSLKPQELHATSFTDDRVSEQEPSEAAVYSALLDALDVSKTGKGKNAADWKWRPIRDPSKGTRGDLFDEIGKAIVTHFAGGSDAGEIAKSQAINAIEYSVEWFAKQGVTVFAEVVTGAFEIKAAYDAFQAQLEIAYSVLELLIALQKPKRRDFSKNERIVLDVKAWLDDAGAEEREAEARDKVESSKYGLRGTRIMKPDETVVKR